MDEQRAEFEAYWRERCLKSFPKDYDMERLSGWGADYKPDAHKAWQAATQRQQERIAELQAQVQALSLDAGRLDWLTFHLSGKALRDIGVIWSEHADARAAIDAAIAAGKGEG